MPKNSIDERTPLRPHVEKAPSAVTASNCIRNYWSQIVILAFIAFGSRGMWSALNALGGAGTAEIHLVTIINVVFSATYFAFGWLGGGILNLTGPRAAVLCGTLSISLLMSLLYLYAFQRKARPELVIMAAALDGMGSVFLWSAISYILLFYPKPSERGRAMTVFNFIYNSGAVSGAVLTALLNSTTGGASGDISRSVHMEHVEDPSKAMMSSKSYLCIVLVTFIACALCGLLTHPSKVTPKLVSIATLSRQKSFNLGHELNGLWFAATHKYSFHLCLFFLVTTWHLVFLFNWVNATYFNVRSRATNSAIYWASRIVATIPLQYALDSKRSSMRVRGLRGLCLLSIAWASASVFVICICFLPMFKQNSFVDRKLDISEAAAIAPFLAFALYGALDTIGQSYAIWLIGALPLDPPTAARLCGVYRSFQGLGQMISWILDLRNWTPYRLQFVICTSIWCLAFIPLFTIVLKHLDPFPEEPFTGAEKEPVALSGQSTDRSIT